MLIRRLWIQIPLGTIFDEIYFVLCNFTSVRSDRNASAFLIVKNMNASKKIVGSGVKDTILSQGKQCYQFSEIYYTHVHSKVSKFIQEPCEGSQTYDKVADEVKSCE